MRAICSPPLPHTPHPHGCPRRTKVPRRQEQLRTKLVAGAPAAGAAREPSGPLLGPQGQLTTRHARTEGQGLQKTSQFSPQQRFPPILGYPAAVSTLSVTRGRPPLCSTVRQVNPPLREKVPQESFRFCGFFVCVCVLESNVLSELTTLLLSLSLYNKYYCAGEEFSNQMWELWDPGLLN